MKKSAKIVLLFFVLSIAANAQSKAYFQYCSTADSLYRAGLYLQSAQKFNDAFSSTRAKANVYDRFKAARSWAMSNEPYTALKHLEILVYKERYGSFYKLRVDTGFKSLYDLPRWKNLVDTAQAIVAFNKIRYDSIAKYFEPALAARLDTVHKMDQYYRRQEADIEKRYGRQSKEMATLFENMRRQDSINLKVVKQVLDTRGWLGAEVVHSGNLAMFLVIQHADLSTQLQYIPMMREAVKNKKLEPGSLAMLEDRVLLRQNKKQIYGTQIKLDSISGKRYVAPLVDPDNVDKRRAEVGLGPISDYISYWDLVWDPEKYKKEIKAYEK